MDFDYESDMRKTERRKPMGMKSLQEEETEDGLELGVVHF